MSACTQRWLICTARGMRIVLRDCGKPRATPAAVYPRIRLALDGRAHGDKFFGRRGMDANGFVKVLFGCASLHGNG